MLDELALFGSRLAPKHTDALVGAIGEVPTWEVLGDSFTVRKLDELQSPVRTKAVKDVPEVVGDDLAFES